MSNRVCTRLALAVLAAAGVPSFQLPAQISGNGTIEGVISDPSGATVPGASVEATQTATGVKTVRQTTTAGYYVLASMPSGEYTLKVTAPGFETLLQQHIIVDALGATAVNATLKVGGSNEQVTVEDTPPALDLADASMSQTVRNNVYTALPLTMGTGGASINSPRDPTSFAQFMPGVAQYGSNNTVGEVNGAPSVAEGEVYIDGLAATTAVLQGEIRYLALAVSIEAVDSFQLQSAGTSVQFGGQGSTNFVIKSGTNDFHGLAYENIRNSDLDSRGFFPSIRPVNKQNEFGGTIGGPIKRNKLFFFGAYTGYRTIQSAVPTLETIPTPLMRAGNFSELPAPIYDPASTIPSGSGYSRTPFPGNIIPPSEISAPSAFLQSFLPAPTSPGIANNYLSTVPVGFGVNNGTEKVDYVLSDKHRLSAYYSRGKRADTTLYRNGFLPLPYTPTRNVLEIMSAGQVKEAWMVSPTVFNEISVGFARFNVPIQDTTMLSNCGGAGGGEASGVGQYCGKWMSAAGIGGLPPGEASQSFPYMTFNGPNSPYSWRNGNSPAFTEVQNNETIQDNLQYTRGRHSLVFGGQLQWLEANEEPNSYLTAATWTFSNAETAGFAANSSTPQSTTGNSYASYLLGALDSASVTQQSNLDYGARFRNFAWWVQDNIKLTPRLTLNLGIRQDLSTPWVEVKNRMSWLNPNLPNPAIDGFPGILQFAGNGPDSCNCQNQMSVYPKNFQPRVGLAYSFNRKTVVRAGYTLNSIRYGAVGGAGAKEGTGVLGFAANPTVATLNSGVTPGFYWQTGFPAYQPPPFFNPTLNTGFYTSSTGGTVQAGSMTYGDPVLGPHPPHFINWNVSVQRELGSGLTLDVAYAASEGHYLNGGPLSLWSDQMNPRYLALGNLLNASATPANVAAAAAIIPGIALPYANYSGNISQMLRPFPQFSGVSDIWGDIGDSNYQSLQVVARETLYHGLVVMYNFTWAKELDNLANYSGWVNDKAEGLNPAAVMNALVVYQLPFGKGRSYLSHNNWIVSAIVSGWQLSGITTWRSGAGLGPITASCTLPNAGSCYASYVPGFSGPVQTSAWGSGNLTSGTTATYLNVAAFQNPAPYTYGTTPRSFAYGLRGPIYFNQNLSLRRTFTIHERVKMTIQADSLNAFNDVSFSNPAVSISSTTFGKITSQANTPRDLQFGARLTF